MRERRTSPRIRRDSIAQLILCPSGPRTAPIDVQLVDFSRTGVGIVHGEAMLLGQKCVLREPFVTQDSTCLYIITRCDRLPDGRFSIGMRACSHADAATDVITRPPTLEDRILRLGYFLFALFGALAIVTMALRSRGH